MKNIHIAQAFKALILLLSCLLVSCSSDSDIQDINRADDGDKTVMVNISLSSSLATTKAPGDPVWTDGEEGENMKSYIVVITDNSNIIKKVLQKSLDAESKQADLGNVELAEGTYNFYSFANVTGLTFTEGNPFDESMTYSSKALAFNTDASLKAVGIPMGNKQTFDVTSSTTDIELYTIRMMAKIEFQIKNETGQEVEISKISVSDITKDADGNILILPKYNGASEYAPKTACMPNLNASASYSDYSHTLSPSVKIADEGTSTLSFYVNESQARSPLYHVITIDMNYAGKAVQQRYAMLDWQYIARNDWRVIPITLTDYVFTCDVEAFTAIGVLPIVTSAHNSLSVTFNGTYGEFHIKPSLKKLSYGSDILYNDSDPDNCWSFTSGIFNADKTLVTSLREDKVDDPSAPSSLTSILSTELTWTPSTKYFEAYMTPYKGYALRTLKVRLPGGKEMKYKIQLTKE